MQFGVKVIFVVLATLSASQGLPFIDSSMTEYEEPLLERNKRTLTTICVEIKPSSPYEEPYFMCKGTDSQFSKGSSESHSSYPSKPSYKPKPSASYGSGESESYHSGVKNDYHAHTKPEYHTDHSKYDKPPAYDSSQDYSAPSKPSYDKKPLYSGHGGQSEYQQYESSKPSSSYPAHKDDYAKPAVHKVTYEKPSVHYEPTHSSKPQTYNHDSPAHGYTESTKYIKPSAYDHQSESGAYSKPSGYDDHRESAGYFKPSSYDQSSSNPSSYNEGSQSKSTYGHAGPSYSAPSDSTHLKPSHGHGSSSYVAPHETKSLYAKPKPTYGHDEHSSYGQSSPSYGEHYSEKPYSKPSFDHQEGYSKPTYSSAEKIPAKTYTAPQKDYKQYATVSGYAPAEHHSATSGYATPPHSSVPSYVPQSHSTVSDYAPKSQNYRVMSPDVMQWQDPQLVQDGHFGYRTMGAPMEYQNFETPRVMNHEEQLQQQYTGLEGPMRFDLSGNEQDSPILQAPYPSQLYSSAQYGYTAPPSPIYTAPSYPAAVSSYSQVPAPSYVPVNYEKVSPSYSPAAPTYLPTPSCPQNFMYSFQPLILPMPCYSSSATYSPPAYSQQLGAPASGAQERSQQHINPLQEPSLVRSESDSEKPKTTDDKSASQEPQETNKKPEAKVETSDPKKIESMKKPEVVDEKPVENKSQDRTVGAENPREEKAKVPSSSKSLEGPDTKAAHDALMRMSKIAATLEKNEPISGADAGSKGQVNEKPPSSTQLFSRAK